MNTVRVAIAQAEVAPNLEAGLKKTRALARAGAGEGAQLVAFEGRCFVLAAGSLMRTSALPRDLEVHPEHSGEWALKGGSMIVGPDGMVLAGPVFQREEVIAAELDLRRVKEESMTLDVSGHYARPDSFEFRPIRHQRSAV